jgi:hypothetical protein
MTNKIEFAFVACFQSKAKLGTLNHERLMPGLYVPSISEDLT